MRSATPWPDVVSYLELMRIMAEERGLRRRLVIPVPVLTPHLSSLWIHLVTPVSHRDDVERLKRKGRDLEMTVLADAVRYHLEHRVLVYGNRTVATIASRLAFRSDRVTAIARTPTITPRESRIGRWSQRLATILMPTKTRMIATPGLR